MKPRPNAAIAAALQPIDPILAAAVYGCWFPPFNHRCSRHWFCPACSRFREKRLSKKYARLLAKMRHPFFLTLTTRTQPELTRHNLTWFLGRLRSFRRWRRFQRAVTGGIYAVEIKLSSRADMWHVHAHIILDLADWSLSKHAIRQAWHQRTGAFMIDFRPIKHETLARVLEYMNKVQELPPATDGADAVSTMVRLQDTPLNPRRLRELVNATRDFRGTQSFGNLNHRHGKPINGQRNF